MIIGINIIHIYFQIINNEITIAIKKFLHKLFILKRNALVFLITVMYYNNIINKLLIA
jgi:hypothetical protein